MKTVSFPGFGISFEINSVAFSPFGWNIYWYGIIIAAGFLLAVLFCCSQVKKFGLKQDDVIDMLLFAVPSAIIGARIYYVLFYLDRYRTEEGGLDFLAMLRIHDGGIAIYGAILGAVLAAYLVMRHKRLPFLAMADLGVFGLLIGQSIGRWGNFVNVEAFGSETQLPWRMEIYQKIDGTMQLTQVHPTFLYESLWNALGFLLLFILLKKGYRKFDGMYFFLYIAWYGIGRFFIEGLRTDSLMLFGTGLRVSQLLALVSAVAAIVFIIYRMSRHPIPEEMLVNRVARRNRLREERKLRAQIKARELDVPMPQNEDTITVPEGQNEQMEQAKETKPEEVPKDGGDDS